MISNGESLSMMISMIMASTIVYYANSLFVKKTIFLFLNGG